MLAWSVQLKVIYNSADIAANLRRFTTGWTYTDNISGQADDLQLELRDDEQLWIGNWMPEKGALLTCKILRENWLKNQLEKLELGLFEIDEVECSYPPSKATIKATSIPGSSALRGEDKNRAWEKTKLSVVSGNIASGAGVKLFYDTDDDPEYDRVEQTEESDLVFLSRLCKDAGLSLKISDSQIVIFDELKYEQQEPVTTIVKGASYIKSYNGKTMLTGQYKSCRVEYHDANKNQTIKHTFSPPNPPNTGRVLVINERVASRKEAERLAKKRLRQENKSGVVFSITMMGDLLYVAGLTVNLSGFGSFDGKYIIVQATHDQRSGYEVRLELRKCLEGY